MLATPAMKAFFISTCWTAGKSPFRQLISQSRCISSRVGKDFRMNLGFIRQLFDKRELVRQFFVIDMDSHLVTHFRYLETKLPGIGQVDSTRNFPAIVCCFSPPLNVLGVLAFRNSASSS